MGLVTNEQHFANTIIILCEQVQDAMPHQRKPAYYINPVIDWMKAEWKQLKPLIVNLVIETLAGKGSSSPKLEAVEELFVSKQKQRTMLGAISKVIHDYQTEAKTRLSDARRLAKMDTIPVLTGQADRVQVMLSKQGLEQVVAGLEFQKDFVDDLGQSVVKRVDRVLKGRYAGISDVREHLNRAFRIDRDAALGRFHDDVRTAADKIIDGKITPARFQTQMEDSIRKRYRQLYREGKGVPLEKWEREFIDRQIESQRPYLSNFRNYIEQRQMLDQDLTGYVRTRAGLYAERGTAIFEAGHVSSLPEDVLLDWNLHPAEHCRTCPIFAANSPYTKATLPGYPGEGFHLTQCGVNCVCSLDISDLYVT